MSKTTHVAVSMSTVAAANWRDVMPPPRKPSSWKDATFAEKLPELLAAQEQEAATLPGPSVVSELWVQWIGHDQKPQRLSKGIATLLDLHTYLSVCAGGAVTQDVFVYGVDIKRKLRQLVLSSKEGQLGNGYLYTGGGATRMDLLTLGGVRSAFASIQPWFNGWYNNAPPPGSTAAERECAMVATLAEALGCLNMQRTQLDSDEA